MLWTLVAVLFVSTPDVALEPTEPWTLSSQDDGCTITRAYDAQQKIQIGFQVTMRSRPAFFFVQASSNVLPTGIGTVAVKLNNTESGTLHYGSFETSDSQIRQIRLFPDESMTKAISNAASITIGKSLPTLHISGTALAINAVDKCASDKLKSWGVDPSYYFQSKTASITDSFAALFDGPVYPKEAWARGISGRVLLLLKTDPMGAVAECKILASSDRILDAETCEIAKRGQLKPPLDASSQPMASYAIIPIIWAHR